MSLAITPHLDAVSVDRVARALQRVTAHASDRASRRCTPICIDRVHEGKQVRRAFALRACQRARRVTRVRASIPVSFGGRQWRRL